MIYPTHFEEKIGFDEIRKILKTHCISNLGKEQVDEIEFCSDLNYIQDEINLAMEFVRIVESEDEFPSGNYFDARECLHYILIEGTILRERELFDIQRSLTAVKNIVHFFNKQGNNEEEENPYPQLTAMCQEVSFFPAIADQIGRVLDKYGRIKDNASPELALVRREKNRVSSSISQLLNGIMRKAQNAGYLEKDLKPSMREGRLVIPVPPAYKRKLGGIVHDESASGKTVFVEPTAVVEANNRVRELESEEKREIKKILAACTDFIRPYTDQLLGSFRFLGKIDILNAKALFSAQIKARRPKLLDKSHVNWKNATHPLLYLSHKKQGREIVPLNIELTQENRLLIISGPNAGGKSICLKTVGLLQYMLQSGLLVPMEEASEMGIFEGIFLDIGDDQSLENDLSTYSSHLSNMKYFLRHGNERSMLLIDEFGTGTEPSIGGAIAEAELNIFNEHKNFGVITTHYTNLKHIASQTDGMINGAMLYDRHHLQALFQLSIGNPGSSFAVEIARKIGLPEKIIETASKLVGKEHIDFDKNLQDIVRDKRYWERKRQQIRIKEKKLEENNQQLQDQLDKINKTRKAILAETKSEAKEILRKTNATIENSIRSIKESKADKAKTVEVRKEIEGLKQELKEEKESPQLKTIRKKLKKKVQQKEEASVQLKVGDNANYQGNIGSILEIKGKKAVMAFGQIKSTIPLSELSKAGRKQVRQVQHKSFTGMLGKEGNEALRQRKMKFRQEIDVRGLRAEEALQVVISYIDDALMMGSDTVRILHGTGTGALRQVIQQYLQSASGVRSAKDEHINLGGSGITVVELD